MPTTNISSAPPVRTVAAARVVQQMGRDIIADIQRGELASLTDVQLREDIARSLFKNRYPTLHATMVQSVAVYGWLL